MGSLLEFMLGIPNWPFLSLSRAILLQAVSLTSQQKSSLVLAEHLRGVKSLCIAGGS